MSIRLDANVHQEARDPRMATWLRQQGLAPDVTRAVQVGFLFIRAEQYLLDGQGRKFIVGDDVALATRWFRRRSRLPKSLRPA